MDGLAVILLFVGLVALGLWSRHLRDSKQMQLRRIIHEERKTAMEKGIPLEDLDHESMVRELALMSERTRRLGSEGVSHMTWIRVSALCFGIIFLFAGVGFAVGFQLIDDPEFHMVWPIGIIPALIGLGLLLFHGLCRGYEKKLN